MPGRRRGTVAFDEDPREEERGLASLGHSDPYLAATPSGRRREDVTVAEPRQGGGEPRSEIP
jgi:hypothetical protein